MHICPVCAGAAVASAPAIVVFVRWVVRKMKSLFHKEVHHGCG